MKAENKKLIENFTKLFCMMDEQLTWEGLVSHNDFPHEEEMPQLYLDIIHGIRQLYLQGKIELPKDIVKSLDITEEDTRKFLANKEKNARKEARRNRKKGSQGTNSQAKKPRQS